MIATYKTIAFEGTASMSNERAPADEPPDSAFINDGYEQTHFIPAVAGLNPDIEFRFRPALFIERVRYRDAAGPEARAAEGCRILHGHVTGWNLKPPVGRHSSFQKLRPHVVDEMLHVILQYGQAKPKPSGEAGESEEERDEKN